RADALAQAAAPPPRDRAAERDDPREGPDPHSDPPVLQGGPRQGRGRRRPRQGPGRQAPDDRRPRRQAADGARPQEPPLSVAPPPPGYNGANEHTGAPWLRRGRFSG